LAALDVASGDVAKLPEEQRVLIRSAVGRIRDIANSLLDKQRAQTAGEAGSGGPSSSGLLLSGLIESLITEKRLQYRSRPGVEIDAWLDAPSYGIFARVQPVEFKRLLSNLVNNAVEAFEDGAGSVRVTLSARDGEALIMVRDDGKGISLNLLSKLGKRGETHGKSGGSGLGLYHARISAESWGGSLEIASEPPKKGAVITVRLPQAQAPDWFVSELVLTADRAVVILDDDASIHRVWDDRLGDLRDRGVEVVHVSAPDELRKWCEENTGKSRGARYLLDFELLGYEDTGLSLADELDIAAWSVLVTSRYEEARVLEECARLKIRMIPKGLAGFVPISLTPARERPDAVLIDDDPLVRMVWTTAAKKAGASLRCCASLTEFETIRSEIEEALPVYLDWDLGEPAGGRPALDRLLELGFKEIHIATGHDSDSLPPLKGISSVRGKEPPWV